MSWKDEWKPLAFICGVFLLFYYLPVGVPRFDTAIMEALYLSKWYVREHFILCLIPALFIAGAISAFMSKNSIMKYLGSNANKALAYGVASVSGAVLAVCSCTVLPLFAGIYKMGAGIGPATAFLYAGPAINVLAIILTARIVGMDIGIARAVGAIVFSVVIGMIMELLFKNDNADAQKTAEITEEKSQPIFRTMVFFGLLIGILVFSNWAQPGTITGFWYGIFSMKWSITIGLWILLLFILTMWFHISYKKSILAGIIPLLLASIPPHNAIISFAGGIIIFSWILMNSSFEMEEWFTSSFYLAKQIIPLLFAGILVSGLLLGRPGNEGIIPSRWIVASVGGNSVWTNFFAAFIGALMYFATLTEVPIVQGLLGSGMGKGPALALLLAGPALSLPSMLVIRSIMGTKKTIVYIALVVVMATVTGYIFGIFVN